MHRKIDIGSDKNVFLVDPKAIKRPQLKFLEDDIPKTPEEALGEARKVSWPSWINSEPLIMGHTDEAGHAYMFFVSENLKKKVIVLFLWDYTLLPCRRALGYMLEWHKRYGHSGLLIIGVHAPMFEFGKDKKLIMDAARELGIQFPVVMDNEFHLWRSLENRYWPRMLLMNSSGKFFQDVVGEGQYQEFEVAIQLLLREISPGLSCPPVMKPLRKIDAAGYDVPTTTHEVFLGAKRGMKLGNGQGFKADNEEVLFKDPGQAERTVDLPYLEGPWLAGPESIYGTLHKGEAKLTINFTGTDVYIVARSKAKNPHDVPQGTKVIIALDHKPLAPDQAGANVLVSELRKSVVQVRDPKTYHIVTGVEQGMHELTLLIEEDPLHTLELFALFFEHKA